MSLKKDEISTAGGGYTFNEALEEAGMGRFQWTLILLTGSVIAMDSCQVIMMTFLVPVLEVVWDMESSVFTLIPVIFLVGVLFGSIFLAKMADMYGRKKTIIFGIVLSTIFSTATIFVNNIYTLLICRFLTGFGYVHPIIIVIVLEYSPVKARAMSVVFVYFCWTAGGIIAVGLAWLILPAMDAESGWRMYTLAVSIPTWIISIASFWVPESAIWYCTIGEFDKAEKLIGLLIKANGKKPLEGRLIQENKRINVRGKIKDVFVPKYRITSSLLIISYATSIFVYYGVVFLSERLFEDSSLYISESVTNISEIPAIALGFCMRKHGWRWMTLFTRVIPAVSMLIAALLWADVTSVSYIWIINVILIFAARGLSLTSSMVIVTYYTVYFPTATRAVALGLAIGISRIAAMGSIYVSEELDVEISLYIFAIVSFVSAGLGFLVKDVSLTEGMTNKVDRCECRKSKRDSVTKGGSKPYVIISSV